MLPESMTPRSHQPASDVWLSTSGEKHELGFRTSQFSDGLPIYFTIQPWVFTPTAVSQVIASPHGG